ncbi:unnamed protein product [Rotaria magnacalcarata]|uniref:Uncharacterized protein n=1 Tax=Rotaria magnacalcarata TaxID=392030 RepID=A0A816K016_9BILA|nr:unnamed protein product [Rotaria magnacalcarata]
MAQVKRQSLNLPITPRKVPPVLDASRVRLPPTRSTRRTQSFRVNEQSPHPKSPLRATNQKQIINQPPTPAPPLPPSLPQSRLYRVVQTKSDTRALRKVDTDPVHKSDVDTTHKLDTTVVQKLDAGTAHKLDTVVVQKLDAGGAHKLDTTPSYKVGPAPVNKAGPVPVHKVEPIQVHKLDLVPVHKLNPTAVSKSNSPKYDPLTGLTVDATTTTTNESYEKSYIISSSINPLLYREQSIYPPTQSSTENQNQQQNQYQLQRFTNNELAEESVVIPTLSYDDGLPVVSIDRNRVPVFARFPFDVTFLPRPMETNVEDNIHKLRLRLIESELNHQRRSTDDYIKRTHRIGMTNDVQDNLDMERDLQIRRLEDSFNNGRQSNQQLMISNYVYDPRLHLQPANNMLEERQYSSSNMDDLIDSMARRHLAYRRFDVAMDHQRRGPGGYSPYIGGSPVIGRQASLLSLQRQDDLFYTNMPTAGHGETDFIRMNSNSYNQMRQPRMNYYNHIQPDHVDLNTNSRIRANSYTKLPPISPGMDSNRLNRSRNPSNSTLYQPRESAHQQRNYQKPLGLPNHTEHLIDLPSDIFLSSRTEAVSSSQHHPHPQHHRHQQQQQHHHHQQQQQQQHHQQQTTRAMIPQTVSKDKSDGSVDSDVDQSDMENNLPIVNHYHHKQKSRINSEDGHDGFFTEGIPPPPQHQQQLQQTRFHVPLFKKVAIGIVFINTLKRRAAKSRINRPTQTLSATIHKIRVQEIMVALHRVYLEPDGPIYFALIQTISSPIELKDALNASSKHYLGAINLIGQVLKNVISKIVDFMPRDGVLGTAKNSAVAALIQDGNPFPDNYFWQCEKEILEFNKGKLINITKQRAILLLIGIFIFRALVTTLLIKPIKYRFLLGELPTNQSASLKVLASVIFYVGRRAVKSISQILALPHEWESSLYSDTDIEPITQHAEIKSIITTCELSLRVWCEEYIRRIDASFGKELRT